MFEVRAADLLMTGDGADSISTPALPSADQPLNLLSIFCGLRFL